MSAVRAADRLTIDVSPDQVKRGKALSERLNFVAVLADGKLRHCATAIVRAMLDGEVEVRMPGGEEWFRAGAPGGRVKKMQVARGARED